jgi:hypothetical protein
MAIAICGSSVTYAKSLVSVQEMAYYTPQMAMGFAGPRKNNQLMLRVQRALQKKGSSQSTMEKIVSTTILAFIVVALAFGSNFSDYSIAAVANAGTASPLANQAISNILLMDLPTRCR